MKVVGELFATGEMQLPFVLQSAETMKTSVAYLEPHMEKDESGGKGRIVLATVKGDVHDIGKNLVDIILTNNGYEVHNLGIKIGIAEMIEKAAEIKADAIGMSGLLVKSTLIMRDNLEELNGRGPGRRHPGAAGRRRADPHLRRARPARGLRGSAVLRQGRLRGAAGDGPPGRAQAGHRRARRPGVGPRAQRVEGGVAPDHQLGRRRRAGGEVRTERSPEVETDNPVFVPPFVGSKVIKGIPLDDIAAYLNETALFRNQWQFRPEKSPDGSVETDAEFKERLRPMLRAQLAEAKAADVLVPQVVYGYFAANSEGNDLIIWKDESRSSEWMRFGYPRQSKEPWLCIADFVRPVTSGDEDFVGFHIVTMGQRVSDLTAKLFAENKYQEYLMAHGLGVEMAEALAEYWHHRVREEWGFADEDGPSLAGLFRQQYRGGRYSWGYPACPDLEDNEKVAELLDAGRIGIEVSAGDRASSTSPSRPPRPSSCTTPEPSTSWLADPWRPSAARTGRAASSSCPTKDRDRWRASGAGSAGCSSTRLHLGRRWSSSGCWCATPTGHPDRRHGTPHPAHGHRPARPRCLTGSCYVPGFVYVVGLIAWRGQTVGEQAMGLRVIRLADRQHPGLTPSLARWLVARRWSCWSALIAPRLRGLGFAVDAARLPVGGLGSPTARACTTSSPG